MRMCSQSLIAFLLSVIALNSVFVESWVPFGCQKLDVFDTFLDGQFPRPDEAGGSGRNVIFDPTPKVQEYLLTYMADAVCSTPNNLFVVRPNTLLEYLNYDVDIQRIDPAGYTTWNSTLVGPRYMPSLSLGQWYLLFGRCRLPVNVNATTLNLNCMPRQTIFVPLQNVTDTIIQVYEGWQNSTDESTRNLEENRLCLRLGQLMSFIQLESIINVMG